MENVFKDKLPFYEFLSHLVIGLFLMPLIIRVAKLAGFFNQFEIPYGHSVYFVITAYAAGLVLHKFIEFLRDRKSPKTTIGEDFNPWGVIFIRNYHKAIEASKYNEKHENQEYYNEYYDVFDCEQYKTTIRRLECQESFLRNLLGVGILYIAFFSLRLFYHLIKENIKWSWEIIIPIAIGLFILLFIAIAYYFAQLKVYSTLREYFAQLERRKLGKSDKNTIEEKSNTKNEYNSL